MDVNANSNIGMTALMLAYRHGHAGVAKLIMDRDDTDLRAEDRLGRTASYLAKKSGRSRGVRATSA